LNDDKPARAPRPKRRLRVERFGRYLLTPTEAAALSVEQERDDDR
jgi:hypothetical protein